MNWRAIRAMVRKDLQVIRRSKAVMLPMIIVPLIMQVLLPAGFALVARFVPTESDDLDDFTQLLEAMPPTLLDQLQGLEDQQLFLVLSTVYLFAPLYLIVPLMVSSVIAADSFAGEKERKTLEALLHSPLTDREMLLSKIISAFVPAMGVSVISFVLYALVANLIGWPLMERIFFPTAMWFVLVFWVSPAVSVLGLGATVLVSMKVRTFQEAQQLAGVIVLPIVILMLGQISGFLFFSVGLVIGLGVALWIVGGIILWFGMRIFRRESLLTQL